MLRIKIPGGFLSADQLERLADSADKFGCGFLHFTTREDAQIYYVKLEEVPSMLRFLAAAGITTREACGNTVRNITACYRAAHLRLKHLMLGLMPTLCFATLFATSTTRTSDANSRLLLKVARRIILRCESMTLVSGQ
jgi:hypothetical protein